MRDFDVVVGGLYDAALSPQVWPAALDLLRKGLGFRCASLSLQALPSGAVLLNHNSGIDAEWAARIPDYAADIVALWGGPATLQALPFDEPAVLSRITPGILDGTCRNRYYLEWRQPQGLSDTVSVELLRDETALASASVVRHRSEPPVSETDLSHLRRVMPHLRRAVRLSRLLETTEIADAGAFAALDRLAVPILTMGPDGTLRHANAAARDLLAEGTLLHLKAGRVRAAAPKLQERLAAALRRAARAGGEGSGPGDVIAARTAGGRVQTLHVVGLGNRRRPGQVWQAPRDVDVLVAISGEGQGSGRRDEEIAAQLGLTRAQARVFAAIAAGRSVAETAATLGIAVSTVRSHLLRIYDICGIGSQNELIVLSGTLRSPLRPGS